jgi:hypothetical protein
MRSRCHLLFVFLLAFGSAASVAAQQPPQPTPPGAQPPGEQTPAQNPDEAQKYEEVVVVTASKTEEKLINAPPR